MILGYSLALWLLSIVMRTIPIGIAYALWSGLGIILVTLVSLLVYSQKPDIPTLLGMACIILGVAIIQLFSTQSGH